MLSKSAQAYSQIRVCTRHILEGRLLAIDPSCGSSSSMPGWAYYVAGQLRRSGIIQLDPVLPIWTRLRMLVHHMRTLYRECEPDVLVYEDIPAQRYGGRDRKGNAGGHASLLKAVGAILSVSGPEHVVGLHPQSWKVSARPSYVKGDENDAVEMGYVAILEAGRIAELDSKINPSRGRKKK